MTTRWTTAASILTADVAENKIGVHPAREKKKNIPYF